MKRKIVLGIGGSSGSCYAHRLMTKIKDSTEDIELGMVMSENALVNWELEIGPFKKEDWPFLFYSKNDFSAPFASGSAKYNTMIICPCSMGLLSRIAQGNSEDLLTRAADVILKERRKLIVVPRETPYNLIHLKNMTILTEAGAIICPATPSFYYKPKSITEIIDTVVDRILDLAGLEVTTKRWGEINF